MRGTVTSVRTSAPHIALTFDDGPDPEVTPPLLDLLARHGAQATFFVVGAAVAAHPALLARIAREGHEIGNHTWSHRALPSLPWRTQWDEIGRCERAIGAGGTRLLRPPYGRQTRGSHLAARLRGYTVVAWSLAADDWGSDPPEAIAERVNGRVRPGDIVLFHDGLVGSYGERVDGRATVVPAVERVLQGLDGRLTSVSVSRLMRGGRPVRRRWRWMPE